MKRLILASKSPRRKQILKDWGFIFEIKTSPYDEETEELKIKHFSPKEFVEHLALEKAKSSIAQNPNSIILAADTTVDLNGKIIVKPNDIEDAKRMLKKLSGQKHSVYTSYIIIDTQTGKKLQKTEKSDVKFREISDTEIDAYLKIAKVSDKAGGYAIQEEGGEFVEYTKGDFLNIVGLPSSVKEDLAKFGIKPQQS